MEIAHKRRTKRKRDELFPETRRKSSAWKSYTRATSARTPAARIYTRAHIKEHNNPNRNVRELNDRKKNKLTTLLFEEDDEEEYKDDDAPRRAKVLVVVVIVIAFVCILRCVCIY